MKHFIIFAGAVCFGLPPAVCRGQTHPSEQAQRGGAPGPGERQDQLFVDGYPSAFHFLAKELSQLARRDHLLVVWLIDESESMRDDQHEVAGNVSKLHAEIHNQLRSSGPPLAREEPIQYGLYSFGTSIHSVLDAPSSDPVIVSKSIGTIPLERSGKENTVHALGAVTGQTAKLAVNTGRRLVLILVTDESGDDGDKDKLLDAAVSRIQKTQASVYVLGREATFGQPYARLRWIHPRLRLSHWLRIRRGPESPIIECLQWDGFGTRKDTQTAGCGPYALVRLAKASGGAYLMLPSEEMLLPSGEKERNRNLLPEKYQPSYELRLTYLLKTTQSPFRSTLQDIIRQFDPSLDSRLSIRENGYPLDEAEFEKAAEKQLSKIQHAHRLLDQSLAQLEKIRKLRERETSARWQAHYDLISAQLTAYRIRLQQAALALDQHIATSPPVRNNKSTGWNLFRRKQIIRPDREQYARLQELLKLTATREEYLDQLDADVETARQQLQDVVERHPNTPWADRAKWELMHGFGIAIRDVLQPPFVSEAIGLPNL